MSTLETLWKYFIILSCVSKMLLIMNLCFCYWNTRMFFFFNFTDFTINKFYNIEKMLEKVDMIQSMCNSNHISCTESLTSWFSLKDDSNYPVTIIPIFDAKIILMFVTLSTRFLRAGVMNSLSDIKHGHENLKIIEIYARTPDWWLVCMETLTCIVGGGGAKMITKQNKSIKK